ncbi:MAG: hypothetical protein IE927_08130 [Rhodobacterales bacterium]|nr:hypothetical protein [Rhodobacterales bacterium]
MRIGILALAAFLALGGCGTRLNPFNWFGGSQTAQVPVQAEVQIAADPRPTVDQVTALVIEPLPGGAILRATGLPPTQAFWNAELVEEPSDDPAVLLFRFVAVPPDAPARVSTVPSREIVAAVYLSDQDLAGIRTITVTGRDGARSLRR